MPISNQTVVNHFIARKNSNQRATNLSVVPIGESVALVNHKTPIAINDGKKIYITTAKFSATTNKIITHLKKEIKMCYFDFELVNQDKIGNMYWDEAC